MRRDFRQLFLLLAVLFFVRPSRAADTAPTSEGAASLPKVAKEKSTELIARFGNESNPVDGPFGPFTYGFRGSHELENGFGFEFGYIRMHEPNTPSFISVLDEGQVTAHTPASGPWTFDLTAWKNRMIDMYTNLIGAEISRKDRFSLSVGAYAGTAEQDDVSESFHGVQVGVSGTIGRVDTTLACLLGKIGGEGSYRNCGVESSMDFREGTSFPLSITLGVEERFFDFGKAGPVSEARDEWIMISGLEIHLENSIFR